jgi:hypothetical protein
VAYGVEMPDAGLPVLVHRIADALRGAMRIRDPLVYDGTQWAAGATDGVRVIVVTRREGADQQWHVRVAGAQFGVIVQMQDGGGWSHRVESNNAPVARALMDALRNVGL